MVNFSKSKLFVQKSSEEGVVVRPVEFTLHTYQCLWQEMLYLRRISSFEALQGAQFFSL